MPRDKEHLEDAAAPDAKHASDPETQGEWDRAAAEHGQSEHLRDSLDDAKEATRRAHEADSEESADQGVQQLPPQDAGSPAASGEADTDTQSRR